MATTNPSLSRAQAIVKRAQAELLREMKQVRTSPDVAAADWEYAEGIEQELQHSIAAERNVLAK